MPIKVNKNFEEAYQKYLKVLDDREKKNLKPISFDDYLWDVTRKSVKNKKEEEK